MAGPTTEVLNDDLKLLRDDLHKVESSVIDSIHRSESSLRESVHKVELDLREVSTQVRGILTAIKLLAVLSITSLAGSIWWGATLSGDVRHLSTEVSELRKAFDSRHDKALNDGQFPPSPVMPPPITVPNGKP